MLNQNEREPLSVAEQVASIYAGTGGYLDRIKVERVGEFLDDLLEPPALRERRPAGADRRDRRALRRGRGGARQGDRRGRSTTSAPTSTRRASRSRRASPTASSPRRSARRPAAPPSEAEPSEEPRPIEAAEDAIEDAEAVDRLDHGHPEGSQEPHRVRQEHPQDHAGDGDGRRGAAAPRRAADRRPAPLRAGDPQDDPAGRRAGRRRCPRVPLLRGARERRSGSAIVLVTGDRGLAGAFNTQDHPRGRAAEARVRAARAPRSSSRSSAAAASRR